MRSTPSFLLLVSFLHLLLFLSASETPPKIRCIKKEKQALLDFKLSFVNGTQLSSWSLDNGDCCTWDGVTCAVTGHVTSLRIIEVDGYELRPSLLELQHLTSLHIKYIDGQLTRRIPKFIGSLSGLTDLELDRFSGEIPPHTANLSKLQSLHLSPSSSFGLYTHNLKWLSRLSSLQSLDLSHMNLTDAIDWASTIGILPNLSDFSCVNCSLPPPILSSSYHANFSTTLLSLDLSNNTLSSSTISYLINATNNLQSLYLDNTNLGHDNNHQFIESLTRNARYSLEVLTLSGNDLTSLPFGGMFPSLTSLDASFNQLNGSLSEILQYLSSNLTTLHLSSNFLGGLVILDDHLSNFSNLNDLDLSYNPLTVSFSEGWVPPFQLDSLGLRSCNVGPSFPSWILTQNNLQYLDMSNSMISGSIPDAFFNFSESLSVCNISHNKISFFPNLSFSDSILLDLLDLSYNSFHGQIPIAPFKVVRILDLSYNNFSKFPTFHPTSPTFFTSAWRGVINLSNNNLSGSLPNWLTTFPLAVLNLENNKLSGTLPRSIRFYSELMGLHLSNNMFSGELPLSMKNCSHLINLELANNKFSGVVPSWLGESMPYLTILNLRSNDFRGDLPFSLCNLQYLQILDLSDNILSGAIPDCLHNFSSMATIHGLSLDNVNFRRQYFDFSSVMWKGVLVELSTTNLKERNVINLSGNLLRGEIPIGVTALKELRSLDLSRNYLNGTIPDKIGQLTALELLKLSSNRLCGEIPQSLAALTFLGTLNLSNNNLSGRIPTSTQLQGFDPSSFVGNPMLCGKPLPTKCPGDKDDDNKQPQAADKDVRGEDNESFDIEAFLATLGMGFAIGFLGILGSLHFIRPWRLAFFQLVNNIADKVIVTTYICIFNKGK